MDSVLRALMIYIILVVVYRIAGTRSLSQITTFDLVLLLVIGEATQQALLGDDFSITNAFVVIITLFVLDIGLTLLKQRSQLLERWLDSGPLVIVEDGKPIQERLHKSRIDESDILEAAREMQGLERIEQIKYAVLERSGKISIIPKPGVSA